jgi:hypothetical protein
MSYLDKLHALKTAHVNSLMALPNVNGVGIGRRMEKGRMTDEIVVGVSVTVKKPREALNPAEVVPERLETNFWGETVSARTDVVEVGEFVVGPVTDKTRTTYRDRIRPIEPGYSVGGQDVTAGTIGCFLVIKGAGHLLSNLHVMQGNPFSPVYQPVMQPGPYDGGVSKDIVGDTALYVPLSTPGSNSMDAATCTLRDIANVHPNSFSFGPLKGYYNQLVEGWHLRKVGRTTGLTDGHIFWFDYNTTVKYPLPNGSSRLVQYDHQIVVKHLPVGTADAGGDSGALWVTDDNYAAALNFAGATGDPNFGYAIATPIAWVMNKFGAQLWVNKTGREEVPDGVDGTDPTDGPYSPGLMEQILSELTPVVPLKRG